MQRRRFGAWHPADTFGLCPQEPIMQAEPGGFRAESQHCGPEKRPQVPAFENYNGLIRGRMNGYLPGFSTYLKQILDAVPRSVGLQLGTTRQQNQETAHLRRLVHRGHWSTPR